MVAPNLLLEQLGREHGATKTVHGYLRRYAEVFEPRRERITSVLEIGVQEGGSLRMWEEYFPNAQIYGIDVDPAYKKHEGGRRKVLIGSSTEPATVDLIRRHHPDQFDIIIDDGSHHPADQLRTFEMLFPLLAEDGFYAIEDIGHTRGPLRLVVNEKLVELVHGINFWPRDMSAADVASVEAFATRNYWIKNVVGIHFFRGLTIVEKGRNPAPSSSAPRRASVSTERIIQKPQFRASRLRELRWPGRFRSSRFIRKSEIKPESQFRLLLRWLMSRW